MLIYRECHGDRVWDYDQVDVNWFLDFETQF